MAASVHSNNIIGISGLRNLGNTCYMNSALQCLSRTTEIQRYLLSARHSEAFEGKDSECPVTAAYVDLLRGMVSGRFRIFCGRVDWDLPICCVFLS
jgi:uncharacterized UBP type Zn finger protein|eukprot:COSAG01_NODE_3878_length_5597_cov_2.765005_10_plen_96_part_00